MFQLFTVAFIILDIVSGIMKAGSQNNISSSIMRQGFYNKGGLLLTILLCTLIEYAISFNIDIKYNIPLVEFCCTYIITMEVISICENVCVITPELQNSKLMKLLKHEDNNE